MSFKIAIVGRPNVGKSSLFNRIVGHRQAITNDKSGTTRDRIYAQAQWLTKTFSVIDTGGLEIKDIPFLEQIKHQAQLALDEAHVVILVVDGQTGLTESDRYLTRILYQTKKPVLVAVNKIDNHLLVANAYDFYALGWEYLFPVSANHGIGVGDLLDKIISYCDVNYSNSSILPHPTKSPLEVIKFCVLGRPNVGKSTLVNALLSIQRMVVSDISGTTTDAVDTFFKKEDQHYQIIDTAGIKKRGKIYEQEDKYSVLRALGALEKSDIACLVLDAKQGIIEQDKNIAGLIIKHHKACFIIVNKWDLIDKNTNTMKDFEQKIRQEFSFLSFAPIIFLSSLKQNRLHPIFPTLNRVFNNYQSVFSKSLLNDILQEAVLTTPPKFFNQRKAKFQYILQIKTKAPEFLCFVNDPKYIHFSYERFLKNQFRKNLNLEGTPLKLLFRKQNIN